MGILNILVNNFFKDNNILLSNTFDNSSYNTLPIQLTKKTTTPIGIKYFTDQSLKCVYKITCNIERWSPKLYMYAREINKETVTPVGNNDILKKINTDLMQSQFYLINYYNLLSQKDKVNLQVKFCQISINKKIDIIEDLFESKNL